MSDVVSIDSNHLFPKRTPKGLLPSTWLGRGVTVEYENADGNSATILGRLVELFPAGPVLSTNGTLTVLSWDRIVLVELQKD